MCNADKNIITGLIDLITKEADADLIAEVLDDIYYILAQNAAADPERVQQGKHELDKNMYYLHQMRDIFAGKHKTQLHAV